MNLAKGRIRRLLAKLPIILLGIVLGTGISESLLRLSGYSFPEFYQLDQLRGYALRPGMEGWYRKEGEAFVKINSEGLRDLEHTKAKPSDTFRIAVLGDSYCEALQVPLEQAFWRVLQNQLQNCEAAQSPSGKPKRVEVINFGVSGYGTGQQLLTLREHVWQYSPDLVLLTVTTNNDIVDNSRALKKSGEIPYFVHRDGELLLDDSFKHSQTFRFRQSRLNKIGRWLKDHFRVVQAAIEGHRGFKILLASGKQRMSRSKSVAATPDRHEPTGKLTQDLGFDHQIYLEPTSDDWTKAWEVTEELIKEIHREVKAHGKRFVLATLSNPAQVVLNSEQRRVFLQQIGAQDLFYPDKRLKRLAEQSQISFIMLAPDLQEYAERHHTYLHGFGSQLGNGHWNPEGHRVAGQLIAQKLCDQL